MAGFDVVETDNDLHEDSRETAASDLGSVSFEIFFIRSPQPMVIVDARGRCVNVNYAFCRLLNCSSGPLLGICLTDLLVDGETLDLQAPDPQQLRLQDFDSRILTVEAAVTAEFLPGRHLIMLTDVSELSQTLQHHQEQLEVFYHVVSALPYPVVLRDSDGAIQFVNPAGQDLAVMAAEPTSPERKPDTTLRRWILQDGTEQWFRVVSVPIPLPSQAEGQLITKVDITDEKRHHDYLYLNARKEQIINTIYQGIRQVWDLRESLGTVVEQVRQTFGLDSVELLQFSPKRRQWSRLAQSQNSEPVITDISSLLLTNYQGITDLLRQFESVQLEQRLGSTPPGQATWILLPLPVNERLWGVLSLMANGSLHPFSIELFKSVAYHLKTAIEQFDAAQRTRDLNRYLEAQVRKSTTQLDKLVTYKSLLQHLTDKVRDSLNETDILRIAVQQLGQVLGVYSCDIGIYNSHLGHSIITYEYQSGNSPTLYQSISFDEYPDIYRQLLAGQHFQFCVTETTSSAKFYEYCTFLACPITLSSDEGVEIYGDLWIVDVAERHFNALEIQLVQHVATQCAIAIRQARLHQATQAQASALERLNLLKDDFLSTVSHELKTPLTNMRMAIHMMRLSEAKTPLDPKQQQYLAMLARECEREVELVNDLLNLQQLEADSFTLAPGEVDLNRWLSQLLADYQPSIDERQQTLTVYQPESLPTIVTDSACLTRILRELLVNACKHTEPHGSIFLNITAEPDPRSSQPETYNLTLQVDNTAVIPKLELDHLFDRFYRVPQQDRWQQGGTGLGLALVKRLVDALQGSIQVISQDGCTTFRVMMSVAGIADGCCIPST